MAVTTARTRTRARRTPVSSSVSSTKVTKRCRVASRLTGLCLPFLLPLVLVLSCFVFYLANDCSAFISSSFNFCVPHVLKSSECSVFARLLAPFLLPAAISSTSIQQMYVRACERSTMHCNVVKYMYVMPLFNENIRIADRVQFHIDITCTVFCSRVRTC